MDEKRSREIKVFLSSTFSDMQETRDYLTKKIFPRIEQECRRRGLLFSVLDLRWGVTEQESKSGKVLEICIDEIKRTRPYFIGLLGDRYGWIPEEDEIARNRNLEAKYPWIRDCLQKKYSITEIEMQYGALENECETDAFFFVKKSRRKTRRPGTDEEASKLKRLKELIFRKADEGKCKASNYSSLKELGRLVYDDLMQMIDMRFPEEAAPDRRKQFFLKQEIFLNTLRENYIDNCERTATLEDDMNFHQLVVVKGESGCGKSALLANAFLGPKIKTVRTCVDETVNSISELISLFLFGLGDEGCGTEVEDPVAEFRKRRYDNPVIWLIDGIDRIPVHNIHEFKTLFEPVDGLKIIVSAGTEFCRSLDEILPSFFEIEITPLEESEKLVFVKNHLKQYGKKLSRSQELKILSCGYLSNPLLLKIFTGQLVRFGVYEELDSFMDNLLAAPDERGFIDKVLQVIEKDFPRDEPCRLLSTLALCQCGVSEDVYMREYGFTPLAWSALYGAAESLVSRQDGHVRIRNGMIAGCIRKRYLNDNDAEREIRASIIRLLLKEQRKFRKEEPLDKYDRLMYLFWKCFPFSNRSARYNQTYRELTLQYIATDRWKEANTLISGILRTADIFSSFEILPLISAGLQHGLRVEKMFSPLYIMLCFNVGEDFAVALIRTSISIVSSISAESGNRLREHLRRMWLPKEYRKAMSKILSDLEDRNPAGGNFEDCWMQGKEEPDISRFAAFYDEICIIEDSRRLQDIRDKAERQIASLPENSMSRIQFKIVLCLCMIRTGREYDKAKTLFREILSDSEVSGAIYHHIKFAFAYHENDWEECRRLVKRLEDMAESYPPQRKRNLLLQSICYATALAERGEYGDIDRQACIVRYMELADDTADKAGTMQYLADWLKVYRLYDASADIYAMLAATADNHADRGYRLSRRADILLSKTGSDYPLAAGLKAEAADCYMMADDDHYQDADACLSTAIRNYLKAECFNDAAKLIEKRLSLASAMERNLTPDMLSRIYNEIATDCYSCLGSFGQEIAGMGLSALMKAISASPDDNILRTNLIVFLDKAVMTGDADSKSVSAFMPQIYQYLKKQDSVPEELSEAAVRLACFCADRKLGHEILGKCGSQDEDNSWKEWYYILIDFCSDPSDDGERIKAYLEFCADNGILNSLWEMCSGVGIDRRIKSLCRTDDSDELLLLWCIARIENDRERAMQCQERIGKLMIAEEEGVDLLQRFLNLNARYSGLHGIDWAIGQFKLIRALKPGLMTAEELCIECLKMVEATAEHDKRVKESGLVEFIGDVVMSSDNPVQTLQDIFSEIKPPETEHSSQKTSLATEFVRALLSPLSSGRLKPDDSQTESLTSAAYSYLDFIFKETDSDPRIMNELFEIFSGAGIKPDDRMAAGMLIFRLPDVCQDGFDYGGKDEFLSALQRAEKLGYRADADILGCVVWNHLLHGRLQHAQNCLATFRSAAGADHLCTILFFEAMLESGEGKYGSAASKFNRLLSAVESENEPEEASGLYIIFWNFFNFDYIFSFCLCMAEILAGRSDEGIRHCERIVYYDDNVGNLPSVLPLLLSGMSEEAEKFLQADNGWWNYVLNTFLEEGRFNVDSFYLRALFLLVCSLKARLYAERGERERALREMENADKLAWDCMPPVCIHEYQRSKSLLAAA